MARVAEQAYRRGVQQGAGLAGKPSFRGDLWEWRYRPSLDLSPSGVDRPTMTTSLYRLDAECGEPLRARLRQDRRRWPVVFCLDGSPMVAAGLAGYTPEQRRLDPRETMAVLRQKEFV